MPGAVIPDDGAIGFSDLIMRQIGGGGHNAKVHLYSNDYVPVRSTVVTDFTEIAYGGYAAQPLPVPTNKGIDSAGKDVWQFIESVFTATGGGLPVIAYGFWVDFLDPVSLTTRVLWSQRFFVPLGLSAPGGTIKFTLSWGGKQC